MTRVYRASPSLWSLYPRVIASRKPALLRAGATVPLIEAEMPDVRIDAKHLRAYREIISAPSSEFLPVAYPHVLASGLHMAVLCDDAFPVRLLGLVHMRNVIRQHRALRAEERGTLRVSIEGHADTERGQEFTLRTRWVGTDGAVAWDEDCIFLARARRPGGAKPGRVEGATADATPAGVRTTSFRAAAGLGRSYGLLGGDLNPIHLSDVTARLFGFQGAIAHGMWSMARCASDLSATLQQQACELQVQFKLPVYLPSWLMLEQWQAGEVTEFCLRDNEGNKPHLTGSLRPLQ